MRSKKKWRRKRARRALEDHPQWDTYVRAKIEREIPEKKNYIKWNRKKTRSES